MGTPAIAHFGITISEAPAPAGVDQRTIAITGALQGQLEFLRVLGFQPHIENFLPGIGRQYIWRRGSVGDVDYIEQDNFTSYTATARPATAGPRQGDAIFRLTHRDPISVFRTLRAQGLIEVDATQAAEFEHRDRDWILLSAPSGQRYELGATAPTAAGNHVAYVWTAAADVSRVQAEYQAHFGLIHSAAQDFHGLARVELLTRDAPGATVGLLHSPTTAALSPRWSEDIFAEAGYPHFRLGAIDKLGTEATARQAFPPGGDVSYVYFADSYLELVQA